MRYEKGHKDATRAHIIDVASVQFREGGVAAVGIAGIMAGAGLTNGAFYNHFESKEDLVEAVLAHALGGRKIGLRANLEAGKSLEAIVRDYLSARHRDDSSGGCPTAALVAEIARHPKTTRDAFTGKIVELIDLIAAQAGKRFGPRAPQAGGCGLWPDDRGAAARTRRQRSQALGRNPGERGRCRACDGGC